MELQWTSYLPEDYEWDEGAPTNAGAALRRAVQELTRDHLGYVADDELEEEDVDSPLNCLGILRWLERSIDVEYAFLIAQARTEGASWSEIGRAIDLTKQAAQQRFGGIVAKIIPFCTAGPSPSGELADVLDSHYQGKRNIWQPGAIPRS